MQLTEWHERHQLVHYTKSPEVVASILENGFLLVPNRRELIERFLGSEEFKWREPQEFGMVSFTELQKERARHHREVFGDFGVVVTWEWAIHHRAQRVLYVGDGPVFRAFKWLFEFGKQEILRHDPEASKRMSLTNRAVAMMYSQMYGHLLTIYEYMQPERDSSQVEWRIANPIPEYHSRYSDRDHMMRELVRLAKSKIGTLTVEPGHVEMLLCPASDVRRLKAAIPAPFQSVPVIPYSKLGTLRERIRAGIGAISSRAFPRWRTVYREAPPPADCVVLRKNASVTGLYALPRVQRINGLVVSGDDILERAYGSLQYLGEDQNEFEVRMPFLDLARLLAYLSNMASEPKLNGLFDLALRRLRELGEIRGK